MSTRTWRRRVLDAGLATFAAYTLSLVVQAKSVPMTFPQIFLYAPLLTLCMIDWLPLTMILVKQRLLGRDKHPQTLAQDMWVAYQEHRLLIFLTLLWITQIVAAPLGGRERRELRVYSEMSNNDTALVIAGTFMFVAIAGKILEPCIGYCYRKGYFDELSPPPKPSVETQQKPGLDLQPMGVETQQTLAGEAEKTVIEAEQKT